MDTEHPPSTSSSVSALVLAPLPQIIEHRLPPSRVIIASNRELDVQMARLERAAASLSVGSSSVGRDAQSSSSSQQPDGADVKASWASTSELSTSPQESWSGSVTRSQTYQHSDMRHQRNGREPYHRHQHPASVSPPRQADTLSGMIGAGRLNQQSLLSDAGPSRPARPGRRSGRDVPSYPQRSSGLSVPDRYQHTRQTATPDGTPLLTSPLESASQDTSSLFIPRRSSRLKMISVDSQSPKQKPNSHCSRAELKSRLDRNIRLLQPKQNGGSSDIFTSTIVRKRLVAETHAIQETLAGVKGCRGDCVSTLGLHQRRDISDLQGSLARLNLSNPIVEPMSRGRSSTHKLASKNRINKISFEESRSLQQNTYAAERRAQAQAQVQMGKASSKAIDSQLASKYAEGDKEEGAGNNEGTKVWNRSKFSDPEESGEEWSISDDEGI